MEDWKEGQWTCGCQLPSTATTLPQPHAGLQPPASFSLPSITIPRHPRGTSAHQSYLLRGLSRGCGSAPTKGPHKSLCRASLPSSEVLVIPLLSFHSLSPRRGSCFLHLLIPALGLQAVTKIQVAFLSFLSAVYPVLCIESGLLETLCMPFCFPVAFTELQIHICKVFSTLSLSFPTARVIILIQ